MLHKSLLLYDINKKKWNNIKEIEVVILLYHLNWKNRDLSTITLALNNWVTIVSYIMLMFSTKIGGEIYVNGGKMDYCEWSNLYDL